MDKFNRWLETPIPVLWLSRATVIQWSGLLFIGAAVTAEIAGLSPLGTLFFFLGMVLLLPIATFAVIHMFLLERKSFKPPDEQRNWNRRSKEDQEP